MLALYMVISSFCVVQVPSVGDITEQWAAGSAKIESYSLVVTLECTTMLMKNDDHDLVVLPSDKGVRLQPKISKIWRSNSKRKGEFGEGVSENKPEITMFYDGQTITARSIGSRTVNLYSGTPFFGSVEYEDYEALYRTVLGTSSRILMTKQRDSRLLAREGSLFIIETPASGLAAYGNLGWRIWLDPDKNFMPVRYTQWYKRGATIERDRDVEITLTEVAQGLWAPTHATIKVYAKGPDQHISGKVIALNTVDVSIKDSKFNCQVDEGVFDPKILPGDDVIDAIRNVSYKVGAANPDKYLDKIAVQAQSAANRLKVRQSTHPFEVPRDKVPFLSWSMLTLVVLATILTIYKIRRTRSR